jgi:hypothetical protein
MPTVPGSAPAPAPAFTVTHDPANGITATATTGALNWPAILKAILAARTAALGG